MTGPGRQPAPRPAPGPGAPALRYVHLHIVLAEPVPDWVDRPVSADELAGLDRTLAKDARAVLMDNGYPVEESEAVPADLAAGWPMWARELDALLTEVAAARSRTTVAYAEAYLAAEGTQQARAATAELAAAAPREDLDKLSGRAEAYRMVLADRARRDAHSAPGGA